MSSRKISSVRKQSSRPSTLDELTKPANVSDWDGTPEGWGRGKYRDQPWSKYVLLARERHRKDLARIGSPDFPFYFDDIAAERAVRFIKRLRHFDSPWTGQPFTLSDWQEYDIVRILFGWKTLDGNRRFNFAYIEIPRKNGKSALAAAISLYLLIGDREHGAQVYCAATTEKQAEVVFKYAKNLLRYSPLSKYVTNFKKSVFCDRMGSVLMPLGGDSKTQDGFSVHGAVIDEYHAHKTSDMLDVLRTGRGARRNSLITIITTAGDEVSSPCRDESDHAKSILEGKIISERYFAFIATVDDPSKWDDRDEWIKANPNYGISIFRDVFESDYDLAKNSPRKQAAFKQKQLNIWGQQAKSWIKIPIYKKSDKEFNIEELKGRKCWGGLDLGISKDLSALALLFPGFKNEKGKDIFRLLLHHWVPDESIIERWQEDKVPYPIWRDQGWIKETEGPTTRYDIIRADINELAGIYDIKELAVDRMHAHQLMVQLSDDGLNVVKHAQTMNEMNFPCRSFEELILQQALEVNKNPLFEWQVGNAAIITNGNGDIKVMKNRSRGRVDGVVAAVMATGRCLISPDLEDHPAVKVLWSS